LTREGFAKADPNRGRFRTFLLASMGNFLSKHAEHLSALKRGGGVPPISLDAHEGEDFFQLESGERFEPERLFDRRWAHQLSKLALDRLCDETDMEGVPGRFGRLRRFLLAEPEPGAYEATASELGISVNEVKTAVRRLRLRFGAILREEVARTVVSTGDVEDELGYLLSVLSAP
jgi:RNA polymerase sigma-70 factor (ECF subfamily)